MTGGAGQVAGPVALCDRLGIELVALDVTLRDLDDPAGNARRVVAAVDAVRAERRSSTTRPVHVGIPAAAPTSPGSRRPTSSPPRS